MARRAIRRATHHMARQSLTIMLLFSATTAAAPAPPESIACVKVQAVARYAGLGYQHLATTDNECARPVRCQLWTDVDPEPRHVVEVPPRSSADTVFRIGSPSREFRVGYRCVYSAR
jgi:hypothetical protein